MKAKKTKKKQKTHYSLTRLDYNMNTKHQLNRIIIRMIIY